LAPVPNGPIIGYVEIEGVDDRDLAGLYEPYDEELIKQIDEMVETAIRGAVPDWEPDVQYYEYTPEGKNKVHFVMVPPENDFTPIADIEESLDTVGEFVLEVPREVDGFINVTRSDEFKEDLVAIYQEVSLIQGLL
jgi:hypothetical protein